MTLGLLLTSFGFGLRHGVDWDHIAAIADLSGSSETRRRGFFLSFLYAVGHAAVVFVLGVAAIAFGSQLPDGIDAWMGRFVGVTLLALGVWLLVTLVRDRDQFRLRSRWMLILDGTFAGLRRVRRRLDGRSVAVVHEHDHEHDPANDMGAAHDDLPVHDHAHVDEQANFRADELVAARRSRADPSSASETAHRHAHAHRHDLALPDRFQGRSGGGVAAGIGMLHGVGVESPTQIAVFVASTAVVGARNGVVLLVAWVAGLILANSLLAIAAGTGLLHAERHATVYRVIGVVVALGSIAMGALYVGGWSVLPEIDLGT